MKESTRVLIALGAAVGGGIAIAASGSAPLLRAADFIAPIGTLWVNAIRMTVIPLVVALIITGVASATDVASVGKLGGRTLLVFLLLLIGTALVIMPFAPSLFALLPNDAVRPPIPPGTAQAAGEVAAGGASLTLAQWLTSLIPTNPIAAAATGQIIPLIIFTLLLAIAIARSPATARTTLVAFFKALGDAMLVLVRWIILLAPIGVFALLLPIAARSGAAFVGAIGFYIVAYSLASLVVTALLYPWWRSSRGSPSVVSHGRSSRHNSSPLAPVLRLPRFLPLSKVPSVISSSRTASTDSCCRSLSPCSRSRGQSRGPSAHCSSHGFTEFPLA